MIDGVVITPLKQILDERGKVMHMLRSDSSVFQSFGEIYFSSVYCGAIKAWHIHDEMILNYAVPVGNIKFVLFDDRSDSPTKGELNELFLGPDNYCLVTVPPKVWNGFKGLSEGASLVANCSSIPHRADEIRRLDPVNNHIPYAWGINHR